MTLLSEPQHETTPRQTPPVLRNGFLLFLLSIFATAVVTMLATCCSVSMVLYARQLEADLWHMTDAMVIRKPVHHLFDINVSN